MASFICVALLDGALIKPGDVLQCVTFVMKKMESEKVATGGTRVIDDRP